jgi:hypothetical protein
MYSVNIIIYKYHGSVPFIVSRTDPVDVGQCCRVQGQHMRDNVQCREFVQQRTTGICDLLTNGGATRVYCASLVQSNICHSLRETLISHPHIISQLSRYHYITYGRYFARQAM